MTNPSGMPIWYELLTPDPAASKAFYDAVVGWTIEAEPAGPIDYRMITAPDGNVGGVMRLDAAMAAGGARPGWLFYLGVDDVDATTEQAAGAGATCLMGPWTIEGVGRMALLADPQGAPLYVMRGADAAATSTVFSPSAPLRVSWNELVTSDQAAALGFYTGLFGWRVGHTMLMGDMGDYSFLQLGDMPLGAAMTGDGSRPPAWRFYTRVAAIDKAAAAIPPAGGSVIHGPIEVPGGDRIILATDPHGVVFGLVGA